MTLAIFDQVNILARAVNISPVQENWKRSDGKGVTFTLVSYYIGPLQYLALARAVSKAVHGGTVGQDAMIMRVGLRLAVCII